MRESKLNLRGMWATLNIQNSPPNRKSPRGNDKAASSPRIPFAHQSL